ncbi:hypothetical protein ACH5RR_018993 [Cinchona calisaya]|uniref:Uncharacterized protein n=1 Tax=Cinchona calisaya TaxID=153742 RepID=A0ABD2ZN16_9GENT
MDDKAAMGGVDEKLMNVLDLFRELYCKRGEFFKKIFPELHEDFVRVFKKIDAILPMKKKDNYQIQVKHMQRSLSVGSRRPRAVGQVDESDELRLNLFKIRTPNLSGVQSGGQGDVKVSK